MTEDADATEETEPPENVLRDHLRALLRYALGTLGVLFVLGFAAGLHFLLMLFGFVFGLIPTALIFLGVGVLHTIRGVRAASGVAPSVQVRATLCLSAPVAAAGIALLAWPAFWAGALFETYGTLAINFAAYQDLVERAQAGSPLPARDRAIDYLIEPGPPVRVAFRQGGFLDNWSGIVFDPTGDVMQARGFDEQGRFHAPDRITRLFGGDLDRCRHLWRDYYDCSFT